MSHRQSRPPQNATITNHTAYGPAAIASDTRLHIFSHFQCGAPRVWRFIVARGNAKTMSISAMPPSSVGEIACGPDSEQERSLGSVGAGWHVDGGQHMTRQVEELDAELRRGDQASATWKEDN